MKGSTVSPIRFQNKLTMVDSLPTRLDVEEIIFALKENFHLSSK
jgi:hypothetical protein